MTAQAEVSTRSLRGVWLPVASVLVLVAALVAVVVVSQTAASSDEPPEPPPFVGAPPSPISVMDVKQRDGNVLTLVRDSGEVAFTVEPGTRLERLQPIEAGDIREGDTVTVIGIPNEVLSFSIHFVVVMTEPATTADGTARSAGGFAGHEASVDPNDRPIIGGVVESVEGAGDDVVFAGPGGPVSLRLNAEIDARLFRLETVDVEAITDGDRIAGAFDSGQVDSLLVMPSGAR